MSRLTVRHPRTMRECRARLRSGLIPSRAPWPIIDPKPFYGDHAYDTTQHLLNCEERLRANLGGTIRRFADLLGVDPERVRLWIFARLAAEADGDLQESQVLARMLMA